MKRHIEELLPGFIGISLGCVIAYFLGSTPGSAFSTALTLFVGYCLRYFTTLKKRK